MTNNSLIEDGLKKTFLSTFPFLFFACIQTTQEAVDLTMETSSCCMYSSGDYWNWPTGDLLVHRTCTRVCNKKALDNAQTIFFRSTGFNVDKNKYATN